MITILYSQLNLTGGIGDFSNVGLDTCVEVVDRNGSNKDVPEIMSRANDRARKLGATLLTWREAYSSRSSGPVLCIAIMAKIEIGSKKFNEILSDFVDYGRKGVAAKFIEQPHFADSPDSTRYDYIINYQPDYATID